MLALSDRCSLVYCCHNSGSIWLLSTLLFISILSTITLKSWKWLTISFLFDIDKGVSAKKLLILNLVSGCVSMIFFSAKVMNSSKYFLGKFFLISELKFTVISILSTLFRSYTPHRHSHHPNLLGCLRHRHGCFGSRGFLSRICKRLTDLLTTLSSVLCRLQNVSDRS